jgi:hypothetical protein
LNGAGETLCFIWTNTNAAGDYNSINVALFPDLFLHLQLQRSFMEITEVIKIDQKGTPHSHSAFFSFICTISVHFGYLC